MVDFSGYVSPFSWRYGSIEMRSIWSEVTKRRLWRRIWAALAEAEEAYGLVTPTQTAELRFHVDDVDLSQSLEIEAEIQHDLMAELKVFAKQCPEGGKILHSGATSADIEDNADALRIRLATSVILRNLSEVLKHFANDIERWAEIPILAFTHLQPAEPSTLGYRLAQYAQDLLTDYRSLFQIRDSLRGKGFKGAVGTGASYAELIGVENLADFEKRMSALLELAFYPITTQVYPRKQEFSVVSALAGLAGTLYKFAFDLRLLQSPGWGEVAEQFGERQVGSSAMPFKRNPINAEKIDSLARSLAQMPRLAWDNASHSLLERTLDDSANRRTLLPEAFLCADELLLTTGKILKGLKIDQAAVAHNLAIYSPFAATERILMALSKKGADRQVVHERLRVLSMAAWEKVHQGQPNPLTDLVCTDEGFHQFLTENELRKLMDAARHVGDASYRALALAEDIRRTLNTNL